MTAPEKMTPQEHTAAMIDRLEALIPLLAGATHLYNPSTLCVSEPEGGERVCPKLSWN